MTSLDVVMKRFDFVREVGGANCGAWVNLFQRFTGNKEGDSWCCSMLCFCLDVQYKGHSPYKKSGVVHDIYLQAKDAGHLVATPQVGDIFFYINDAGHTHHIGVVTGTAPLTGFAGNTSEDGKSSNGTGAFEHEILIDRKYLRFARPR